MDPSLSSSSSSRYLVSVNAAQPCRHKLWLIQHTAKYRSRTYIVVRKYDIFVDLLVTLGGGGMDWRRWTWERKVKKGEKSAHHTDFVLVLDGLLPHGLDRQGDHGQQCSEEETTRCVDGRNRARLSTVYSNDGGAQASKSVQETSDTRTGASVRCREDLRGVREEHAVHDVLEESFQTGEGKLGIRVPARSEQEQEDARQSSRDSHCTLATDVLDVNAKIVFC